MENGRVGFPDLSGRGDEGGKVKAATGFFLQYVGHRLSWEN